VVEFVQENKEPIEVIDFIVLMQKILEFEEKGKRISFSKLVESLTEKFSKGKVAELLSTLEGWFVVSSEDGEISLGHAEALYYLTEKGKKYWE